MHTTILWVSTSWLCTRFLNILSLHSMAVLVYLLQSNKGGRGQRNHEALPLLCTYLKRIFAAMPLSSASNKTAMLCRLEHSLGTHRKMWSDHLPCLVSLFHNLILALYMLGPVDHGNKRPGMLPRSIADNYKLFFKIRIQGGMILMG